MSAQVTDFRQATQHNGRSLEPHVECVVEVRPSEHVIEGQLIYAGAPASITVPESTARKLKAQVVDAAKLQAAATFLTRKKRVEGQPTPTVESCYYELHGECIPPLLSLSVGGAVAAPMPAEDVALLRLSEALSRAQVAAQATAERVDEKRSK